MGYGWCHLIQRSAWLVTEPIWPTNRNIPLVDQKTSQWIFMFFCIKVVGKVATNLYLTNQMFKLYLTYQVACPGFGWNGTFSPTNWNVELCQNFQLGAPALWAVFFGSKNSQVRANCLSCPSKGPVLVRIEVWKLVVSNSFEVWIIYGLYILLFKGGIVIAPFRESLFFNQDFNGMVKNWIGWRIWKVLVGARNSGNGGNLTCRLEKLTNLTYTKCLIVEWSSWCAMCTKKIWRITIPAHYFSELKIQFFWNTIHFYALQFDGPSKKLVTFAKKNLDVCGSHRKIVQRLEAMDYFCELVKRLDVFRQLNFFEGFNFTSHFSQV